jgi:hypothetical protein
LDATLHVLFDLFAVHACWFVHDGSKKLQRISGKCYLTCIAPHPKGGFF